MDAAALGRQKATNSGFVWTHVYRGAALLVSGLAWLLLPVGSAAYVLTLDDPELAGIPIVPHVDGSVIMVPWTVSCTLPEPWAFVVRPTAALEWNPVPTAGAEGVLLLGSLSEHVRLPDCVSSMATSGISRFEVQADGRAPGIVAIPVRFDALLHVGGPTGPDPVHGSTTANVEVAYAGRLAVKAPISIQDGGGGDTSRYRVFVENLGNAPTLLRFDVVKQPAKGSVSVPEDVVVPWDGGEPTVVEVQVQFHHPSVGLDNREDFFQITITPVAEAAPGMAGEPETLNMLARTSNLSSPVATTGYVLVMVLAVVLAATLVQRFTRRPQAPDPPP